MNNLEKILIFMNKWGKIIIFLAIMVFLGFLLAIKEPYDLNKLTEKVETNKPTYNTKSTYEENIDFGKELDRMITAGKLDRMEEERREIDKYRKYKD